MSKRGETSLPNGSLERTEAICAGGQPQPKHGDLSIKRARKPSTPHRSTLAEARDSLYDENTYNQRVRLTWLRMLHPVNPEGNEDPLYWERVSKDLEDFARRFSSFPDAVRIFQEEIAAKDDYLKRAWMKWKYEPMSSKEEGEQRYRTKEEILQSNERPGAQLIQANPECGSLDNRSHSGSENLSLYNLVARGANDLDGSYYQDKVGFLWKDYDPMQQARQIRDLENALQGKDKTSTTDLAVLGAQDRMVMKKRQLEKYLNHLKDPRPQRTTISSPPSLSGASLSSSDRDHFEDIAMEYVVPGPRDLVKMLAGERDGILNFENTKQMNTSFWNWADFLEDHDGCLLGPSDCVNCELDVKHNRLSAFLEQLYEYAFIKLDGVLKQRVLANKEQRTYLVEMIRWLREDCCIESEVEGTDEQAVCEAIEHQKLKSSTDSDEEGDRMDFDYARSDTPEPESYLDKAIVEEEDQAALGLISLTLPTRAKKPKVNSRRRKRLGMRSQDPSGPSPLSTV